MHLTCPLEDCELDIVVDVESGSKGSSHEPPYEARIDMVTAPCGHEAIILASPEHMANLWRQVEHEEERAYDDAQEARVDAERDKWYDE